MASDKKNGIVYPALPDPVDHLAQADGFNVIGSVDVYTAEQMRAYAAQAVAIALADEDIQDLGISLRDYFAAKGLHGLVANPGGPIQANSSSGWGYTNTSPDGVATQAYALADAMLKARQATS